MKKILIVLLSITMFLTLTACGSKNNENSMENNNGTSQKENEEVNNNEKEKQEEENNDDVYIDDEIIEWDDVDNTPMNDGDITVEGVINCRGCVYAYYSDEGDKAKTLGATLSPNEYTKNINDLKTPGGKQRHNFFGLILSDNTISRAYACVLKDNKIYCIEGSTSGAYYESNVAILNKLFTSKQCKTISNGHTYTCTDGNYNGDTQTTGYTSMHYETSCTIYGADSNTGKLICH